MNLAITINELSWPKKFLLGLLMTLCLTTFWNAVHTLAVSAYGISGAVVYEGFNSENNRPFPASCLTMRVNTTNASANPTSQFQGLSGNPTVGTSVGTSVSCWGRTYTYAHRKFCRDAECNTANNWPNDSTAYPSNPVAPVTRLDYRWYFQGPIPPRNYTAQGAVLYNGNNWLPDYCWTVTASSAGGGWGQDSTNTWGVGNLSPGNPTVSVSAGVLSCADGNTYRLQSSSNPGPGGDTTTSAVCYNSGVNSPTSCSDGTFPSRDFSGSTQRGPADPNFQNLTTAPYLSVNFYYVREVKQYTVQGLRTYNNGGSSFPAGYGSTWVYHNNTGSTLSTTCNAFVFPNSGGGCASSGAYNGLVQIYNSLTINYAGTTYTQVGYTGKNGGTASTICYNNIVPSCPGPSSASLSQLPPPDRQRSPADPTTLPGGPPYYIDVKTFYEPACSDFTVYALNDTATLKYAIQNGTPWTPYQGPPPGGGYPSRDHVIATIGGSMNGSPSSGCNGYYDPIPNTVSTGFPSSTTTHDCPAGTINCPDERVLYMPPGDVSKITMTPPTQLAASASHPQLTFVGVAGNSSGVSVELGTDGQEIDKNNTRKFPDVNCGSSPCPITAPNGYRLIYHYVDCSDVVIKDTAYCPVPKPTCEFVPTTALTVNYNDTITLSWTVSNSLTSQIFDPGTPGNPADDVTLSTSTRSRQVTVTANTTYKVTVSNGSGSSSCTKVVNLSAPSCNPPSSNYTIGQASGLNFFASGGNNSYTWSTSGASANGTPTSSGGATNNQLSGVRYDSGPTPSTYNVTVSSNGQTSPACIVNTAAQPKQPYVRVYGGDVVAGSGLGSACLPAYDTTDVTKIPQIFGFNSGAGAGSGTGLANFALSTISGFSSANGRTATPQPAKGLSFANTTGAGDTVYGGDFDKTAGAHLFCAVDYWATSAGAAPLASGSNVGTLGTAGTTTSYALTATPFATINGATGIADSKKVAIYAQDTDVVISGNNIYYTGSDTWDDISQVPSFYLVVRNGNIYIDSSITRLDGVYVALPGGVSNTANGVIYTCTSGHSLFNSSTLFAPCNNQLVINGAFVARQVKFQRAKSDISTSSNGQLYTDTNITEVFKYSPELWLTQPAAGATSKAVKYDSITGLPPVL